VSTPRLICFAALVAVVLAADPVSAAPPAHSVPAVRPLGPATRPYNRAPGSFYNYGVPSYSSPRVVIRVGIGAGYGSGLYGPLSYGLGYSPFGYSGLTAGGVGYGPLGYGYPRPVPGAMIVPPSYAVPSYLSPDPIPYRVIPAPAEPQVQPPQSDPKSDPEPLPLPIPPSKNDEAAPATVVVVANEGVKVTFEGIANTDVGTHHSFITRPIAPGREVRVMVKVDGPGGASTFGVRVRAGEKAVVDLRK
jgi:uncharacterized protein (TIGR03000 family)